MRRLVAAGPTTAAVLASRPGASVTARVLAPALVSWSSTPGLATRRWGGVPAPSAVPTQGVAHSTRRPTHDAWPHVALRATEAARAATLAPRVGSALVACGFGAAVPAVPRRGFAAKPGKGGKRKGGKGGTAKPAAKVNKAAGRGGGGGGGGGGANNGHGVVGEFTFGVKDLSKTLPGGRPLYQDVNLSFLQGAKVGMLGPNGVGKSSLMKAIAGVDTEVDGSVWTRDGLRVGYLAQEPVLDPGKDVHGNIMDGLAEKTTLLARYEEICNAMADPDADFDALLSEQADVQVRIDELDCWNLDHTIAIAKEALRVPPDDADVTKLSGGERRRVALCRLLLEHPEVLLLDEPTNHLDAQSVHWLERFLQSYTGTVVAITHDRYFLDNVAGWILELEGGRYFVYEGNYSYWLEQKQMRLDQNDKREARRKKALASELAWIRQGTKGRQSKGKARVKAYESAMAADAAAKATEKFLGGAIVIPPGPRLGDVVVELDGVSHSFDGRPVLKDVSLKLTPGSIVGVVGPNGIGKSTLMRIIMGELTPESGRVDRGSTVEIGLVAQSRQDLNDRRVVHEEVAEGQDTVRIGTREVNVRAYMSSFNLSGPVQQKRVGDLSGGERNRVHLAKTLKRACNVLLLDEPTNDLDVDTLMSLEEALEDFSGVSVIVSHDRYFLDRVCTHTVAFLGDGVVDWYPGNFSEYEEFKLKTEGVAVHALDEALPGIRM